MTQSNILQDHFNAALSDLTGLAGLRRLSSFLKAFFTHYGFAIMEPGDGSLMSFHGHAWDDVSFLARKGADVFAPLVVSRKQGGAPLWWLRREVEAAGGQLISVQPTDRIVETVLKRTGARRSIETIGDVELEVWRIPKAVKSRNRARASHGAAQSAKIQTRVDIDSDNADLSRANFGCSSWPME